MRAPKLALAGFLLAFPVCGTAQVAVQSGAPSGFETLAAPRATRVDLYYGGASLGSVPAHFSPGKLSFDNPADVTRRIPAVADAAKVQAVLSQPLDAHLDKICAPKRTENCGTLTPDVAGVIFDENNLAAELFVNKADLLIVDDTRDKFLPLPEKNLSTVSGFNGAVSGQGTRSPSYTLSNSTVLALGEAKLATQTTAANTGLRFDTAAANIERDGWSGTGGLFRSHAMQLLSDRDMAGIGYSTSAKTWLDDQKTRGNDVIVYLPRRSYVSIYREGRLYSSQAYEAGNQTIDTSALPDGAYEITLRIQDANGETREERRFFAKTQDIPPPDRPSYYVEGGLIRKPAGLDTTLPEVTAKPIARAGITQRLSDTVGLTSSFLVKDRAMMENGVTWIDSGMKFSTSGLVSTKADYGVAATYIQSVGNFSVAVDVRKTWMNHTPIPGFEDLSANLTEVSTTLSYLLTTDLTVGARGSYVRQDKQPLSTSLGPYAEWRLWSEGESTLGLAVDAAHTDRQNEASALLHFSYRFGDYNVSGAGGLSYDQSRMMPTGNVRASHDDQTPGNELILGGGVSADTRQQVFSTDADWRNEIGSVRGSVQEATGKAGTGLGYGGDFHVSATQVDDEFHIGGDQSGNSAVVVSVEGDADADMRIFVNGVERSHVAVGHAQVVYLAPYHVYDIRVAPVKNALLDYESGNRRITVYSGNVVRLKWSVNKLYVVTGKVVTPDAQPLVNATLGETRAQVVTDAKGRVQAELSSPHILTFKDEAQHACQVMLPVDVKPVNGVLLYGKPLTCQPITESASR